MHGMNPFDNPNQKTIYTHTNNTWRSQKNKVLFVRRKIKKNEKIHVVVVIMSDKFLVVTRFFFISNASVIIIYDFFYYHYYCYCLWKWWWWWWYRRHWWNFLRYNPIRFSIHDPPSDPHLKKMCIFYINDDHCIRMVLMSLPSKKEKKSNI